MEPQREEMQSAFGLYADGKDDGRAHFRAVLARVVGPPCIGFTFGWDVPTSPLKPYFTLEVIGWMLCLGWVQNFENAPCQYERQAYSRVMKRDYWSKDMTCRLKTGQLHDTDTDTPLPWHLASMQEEAGIRDGDEFEILITACDNRPHGDRRYLRDDSAGLWRPETDDECLRRIEDGDKD